MTDGKCGQKEVNPVISEQPALPPERVVGCRPHRDAVFDANCLNIIIFLPGKKVERTNLQNVAVIVAANHCRNGMEQLV